MYTSRNNHNTSQSYKPVTRLVLDSRTLAAPVNSNRLNNHHTLHRLIPGVR
jgi:hypothetical protein